MEKGKGISLVRRCLIIKLFHEGKFLRHMGKIFDKLLNIQRITQNFFFVYTGNLSIRWRYRRPKKNNL